jgi:hypothetical protein
MKRDLITIGTATASPGHRSYGQLKVAELHDSSPVEIPVAIVNGREEGPVLWIQNAVHGDEYVGLGAIQRLLKELNPETLRGTVIAIPVVNILAYRARQRSAPQDGVDMNRIWPGKPLSKAMQLQAHTEIVVDRLFGHIRDYADYIVDCHDGSTIASMAPYVAYFSGAPDWERASRELAIASGMTIVWRTESGFVAEKFPGSLKVEMVKLNTPGVTLEMGGQGRLDEVDVARMHLALRNMLFHLKMVDGNVTIPEEQIFVSKGNWLRPSVGGVFWPNVKPLQRVKAGELFATVTDLFGQVKERLLAPADGVIIGIRTAATTASGEYAGNVGVIDN